MVSFLLVLTLAIAVAVLLVFVLGTTRFVALTCGWTGAGRYRRSADSQGVAHSGLVNTVQTFAAHEKAILDHVADAQTALAATTSGSRWRSVARPKGIRHRRGAVLALGQTYPQLNSSNNFLNLQQNLADTEDKVGLRAAVLQRRGRDR